MFLLLEPGQNLPEKAASGLTDDVSDKQYANHVVLLVYVVI